MKKEIIVSVIFPIVFSICCFIFANWILPPNCSLFISDVPGPLMCDSFPQAPGCDGPFCQDRKMELIASIVAGFGLCLLFLPIVINIIKEFRSYPIQQTKLFD